MRHAIMPALPADAPEILALQRLAYQTEARLYGDWSIPPLTQSLEELREEFGRLTILKALDQDEAVIGSVRAELDASPRQGTTCRIGRLIVHPKRQRQGLGAALLEAIEASFPQAERFALFTGSRSEDNLRLYQRGGYQPVDSREVTPGLTLVFLEKPGPARRQAAQDM
jgi:GNAT superfamily N-acetyltransferase